MAPLTAETPQINAVQTGYYSGAISSRYFLLNFTLQLYISMLIIWNIVPGTVPHICTLHFLLLNFSTFCFNLFYSVSACIYSIGYCTIYAVACINTTVCIHIMHIEHFGNIFKG